MVVRTEGPVHQDQTVTTKSLLPNLKIEIETRNSKSKLEIEIGNRNWKSKLEIEIGNRNSKSKLEIETRSLVQFSRLSNFWGRPSVVQFVGDQFYGADLFWPFHFFIKFSLLFVNIFILFLTNLITTVILICIWSVSVTK